MQVDKTVDRQWSIVHSLQSIDYEAIFRDTSYAFNHSRPPLAPTRNLRFATALGHPQARRTPLFNI